jgi:hypothetical protein
MRTIVPAGAASLIAIAVGFGGAWLIVFVSTHAHVPGLGPVILGSFFLFAGVVAGVASVVTVLLDVYFGRPARLSRMLTGVRRTWLQLSLLMLTYFTVVSVPAIAVFAALSNPQFSSPFFSTPNGEVAAFFLTMVVLLALIVAYGFAACVGGVAFVGCIGEWSSAVESWLRGWDRSIGGGHARTTFVYGALIALGGVMVTVCAQLPVRGFAWLLSWNPPLVAILAVLVAVVVQLFYLVFSWAFFVVYYVDLRVRSEGLDLGPETISGRRRG